MSKIRTLTQEVISKTAAGEVVERPSSVIKELLDNALDAKATRIKIEVEESGMKKILLVDNGEGMEKEDVLECFKPHTTSKIFTVNDLIGIRSLGFRGEALNSIASVSNLCISSRTANSGSGTKAELSGGVVKNSTSAGMPVGTTVEVSELFFNIPARKKFLKSPATEFRHILETVVNAAIANPRTGVYLKHNKKVILDLPKDQTENERIRFLLGQQMFNDLIPITAEDNYHRISGFISVPQGSSDTQRTQFLFVNGRCVKNQVVANVIKDSYKSLLEPRALPAFVLFLNIPHEMVDVNIHPRKEEIAFYDENLLRSFLYQKITETLEKTDLTYSSGILGSILEEKGADPHTYEVLKDSVDIWKARGENYAEDYSEVVQIHNLYLVTQTKKGLLIVDQHAAHERILYEQFLEAYHREKKTTVVLKEPLIMELPLPDIELLKENLNVLKDVGISIEEFGKNTFKISEVPELLQYQDIVGIIKEMLGDISEGKKPRDVNKKSLRTISFLACRSAVKAGDYLSQEERKKLLKKLSETKTNYTCPHGRPAKIDIPLRDLDKLFRRIH